MICFFRVLILMLLFAYCKKSSTPEWYMNPKKDNNYLYGIGFSAVNYEDAKRKALIELTSQLKVKVNAETYSNVDKRDGAVSRSFSQTATAQVESLEINSYEVAEQVANSEGFYILISVNKKDLIRFLDDDISFKMKSIKNMIADIKDKNASKRIAGAKKIRLWLASIKEKDFIIRVLDKNYSARYQDDILSFDKKILELKDDISFYIDCQDSRIKNSITQILIQNGYKISSQKNIQGSIVLKTSISLNENKLFDAFISKANIQFSLEDNSGSFGAFSVSQNGMSVAGKEQAVENLYQLLAVNFDKNLMSFILDKLE